MADQYLSVYEADVFENGELAVNEYAIGPVRFGVQRYWVRIPESEKRANRIIGYTRLTANPNDILGKSLVQKVGTQMVAEFQDDVSRNISRDVITQEKFERMKTIRNEPPPTRQNQAATKADRVR